MGELKNLLVPFIILGLIAWAAMAYIQPKILGIVIAIVAGLIFLVHYLLPLL